MTRIQLIIIVALVVIIAAIAGPRALKMSRISRAEQDAAVIAGGFARYRVDMGQECARVEDLMNDPGVPGWRGPYIDEKVIRNPWGGKYEVELGSQKIGIPRGDAAPDRYEFGGSEEISFSFAEDVYPG
jgi:hypothetical protein